MLNADQKKFIDNNYIQIPDIDQLTRTIFKSEELDGRNKEGKAVAAYMLEKGYNIKPEFIKK